MRLHEIVVSCMPLQMKISLDSSSKTLVNEKSMKEQKDQILKEPNKQLFDAHEEGELEQPKELDFPKHNKRNKKRNSIRPY